MASPGVFTYEKDLTYTVTSSTSNATGFVGVFRWGPVEDPTLISVNEAELASRFMTPDSVTARDFLSAANFLLYSLPLYVVRAIGDAAKNAVATGQTARMVKNEAAYDVQDFTGISVIGRYPGAAGNSLRLSMTNSEGYATWAYRSYFQYAPTSASEYNVVVIDEDGVFSGTPGTVLETYEQMTLKQGDTKLDGTTAYLKQAVEDQSRYIYIGDVSVISAAIADVLNAHVYSVSLSGGADDNDLLNADYTTATQIFLNEDLVEVFRIFTANPESNGALVDVAVSRQDCIAFVAPPLATVYNNPDAVEDVVTYYNTTLNKNESYGFGCDNWKLVYDKYRDTNVWIPCSSDTAGLHARMVNNGEAWQSPAGLNRGQLKNVIRLAWNPNKSQRGELYKNHINSIVSFPGEGTVLWGDKTMYRANSAFNRINVRSLFIVLRKDISKSAKYLLFELNDATTRLLFRNSADKYLENVQGRGGIYDRRVVCDETNNTAQVIDSNEFVGDIYVKPARSINVIKLNFVAVATSVDFSEIES